MNKKTLLLTLEYPPQKGGVAKYLENLVNQYDKEEIIVLTNNYKNSYTYDFLQNYKIKRTKLLGFLWPKWFKTIKAVSAFTKENNIDYIIISHVLPMGYVTYLLGLPYTVILHGLDLNLARSKPLKKFMLKLILNKATKIIVNSNYTKTQLLEVGAYDQKTQVVYPVIKKMNTNITQDDINKIKEKYNINNLFTLISVNRLVEKKGNDNVICAISELIKEGIKLQYLIIGNGPYQNKLQNLIKDLQLEDSVKILNDISDEELPVLYAMSDLFIMISRITNGIDYEGFGIVYLEADQFNLPIIAGITGGVPEAISMVKNGTLIDPNNIKQIVNEILKIYEQKN